MKITILVEGETERAFLPHLRAFLGPRLEGRMPRLDPRPFDGRLPKGEKLRREVERLLRTGDPVSDYVIALTDVYTGTTPPEFEDAGDAKKKMRQWVGQNERFFPHAAQFDFEAWLLPFWVDIQTLAKHNGSCPSGPPERVNHGKPPSRQIADLFRKGKSGRDYVKPRDAGRILRGKDLAVAAAQCPELKDFLNTILSICKGPLIL